MKRLAVSIQRNDNKDVMMRVVWAGGGLSAATRDFIAIKTIVRYNVGVPLDTVICFPPSPTPDYLETLVDYEAHLIFPNASLATEEDISLAARRIVEDS